MPEGEKQTQQKYRNLPRIRSEASPALTSFLNKIAEEVERLPPRKPIRVGKGLLMDDDEYTTTIRMGANASPPARWYPFKLYPHGGKDSELKVRVYYGTIDGNVPVIDVAGTKIAIHDDSDTNLGLPFVEAGTDSGEYVIYIAFTPNDPCTTENEIVTTAPEIKIISGAKEDVGDNSRGTEDHQVPVDTNELGHVELGRVTVVDLNNTPQISKIHQSVTHSLKHKSCGVSHFFWGV
jgi:hypothetical protein